MSETQESTSIIHQLPPEISNKIAAGEVIQRPSSVVKELLDNAIDAGADSVKILIEHAGRTLIQVIETVVVGVQKTYLFVLNAMPRPRSIQ